MRNQKLFFAVTLCGILALASVSRAQTGYRIEDEREAIPSREANIPVVKVYGPDVLTELTRQAIREKRPDVAIETYYEPLKNKVRIEGTTGADYMPLSPKRVSHMQTARARGESVFSALCKEQKGVIRKTVGEKRKWVRVERREERKEVRTRCYVRTIYPSPPVVFVPGVHVGLVIDGVYPFYGYRTYGVWEDHHYHSYRMGRGYSSYYERGRGHRASGAFHRGRQYDRSL